MSTSYFAGCTVLVTGASAGIGREFARQLAPVVDSMILVARRADRLEALELELKVINPNLDVFYRALDLRNHDDLAKFCDWLEESGLAVDLLINNAGLGDWGPFIDSEWDKVNAMLRVNIEALTYLTYRILPSMGKSGCGAILNVSSVAGFLPVPTFAVYAATKAYVTSFSEALRAELRSSNISVTVLCPGPVSTEFGSVAVRPGTERRVPPDSITVPVQTVVQEALASVARDRPRLVPGIALRFDSNADALHPNVHKTLNLRSAAATRGRAKSESASRSWSQDALPYLILSQADLVTAYYYLIFGIICILGGALGYARARSKASIIAGGVSGALLILAGILARGFIPYVIAIVVSLLLLAHFGRSFVASRKPMPAIPMILLSLVCIALTVRHLIH